MQKLVTIVGSAVMGLGLLAAAVALFAGPLFPAPDITPGTGVSAGVPSLLTGGPGQLLIVTSLGFGGGVLLHWLASKLDGNSSSRAKPIESTVIKQKYSTCTVKVDGKKFVRCSFDDVTFHWDGIGQFYLEDCDISGKRGISVRSGRLGMLLNFIKMLNLHKDGYGDHFIVKSAKRSR